MSKYGDCVPHLPINSSNNCNQHLGPIIIVLTPRTTYSFFDNFNFLCAHILSILCHSYTYIIQSHSFKKIIKLLSVDIDMSELFFAPDVHSLLQRIYFLSHSVIECLVYF